MSQILVQQRKGRIKRLTIHEISPQWARLLPIIPKTEEQEFYRDGTVLDISNPKFCIVGEAHKFNGDYMNCMNKESFCRGFHTNLFYAGKRKTLERRWIK